MNSSGQTICLNMIVKNEAPVIRRCLDTMRPLIDHWVIVDTGSTDGTQEIIREHLAGLPGELIERPWVNFAHNRSEALEYARGRADYVFVIDADETLEIAPDALPPLLTADSYNCRVSFGAVVYLRKQLLKNTLPWRYEGVLHEYSQCDTAVTEGRIEGLTTYPHRDGARARDPLTYRRDALLLEQALLDDPQNARYVFYLGQSYRDCGDTENAIRNYRRRVEMGGWPEEVWYSLYQIAQIKARADHPWNDVLHAFLDAYQHGPGRAEPLFRIGMHYQGKGEYATSNLFFSRGMELLEPSPTALFLEKTIYDYLLPLEYAVSCYYIGKHAEAVRANNALLRDDRLPATALDQVVKNRRFSLDARHKSAVPPQEPAGPMKVLVVTNTATHALDDCLMSLCLQTSRDISVTVAGDRKMELADRVPPGDARFSTISAGASLSWKSWAGRFLFSECEEDDLVLLLADRQALASPGTLSEIRAAFKDPACMAVYGQFCWADGRIGDAEPAADEAEFRSRLAKPVSQSVVAFRASLRRSLHLNEPTGDPAVETESTVGRERLIAELLAAAGFSDVRFLDGALTIIRAEESSPSEGAILSVPIAPVSPESCVKSSAAPCVSCVMVTRDRLALAKQSIDCYRMQSHPSRELVIVTDGADWYRQALERYIAERGVSNARVVAADGECLTLGRLRNLSFEAAEGEYVCQWDDDDYNHPERLATQLALLRERDAAACCFTDQLQLLADRRLLHWIDWTNGGAITGEPSLIPGTLMMRRSASYRYPETGEFARRGEDSALLTAAYRDGGVAALSGSGYLYVYQYHGRNTFPQEHHSAMARFGMSAEYLRDREPLLRAAIAGYPVVRPLIVAGRDGVAFHVRK